MELPRRRPGHYGRRTERCRANPAVANPALLHLPGEIGPSGFSPDRCIGRRANSVARTPMFVLVHAFDFHHGEHRGPRCATEFFMLEHQASRKGGCAVEVHRTVRPGLLESVYAKCRALEPGHAGIRIEARTAVPVIYKGVTIPLGFRLKTPSFSKSKPSPRFSRPMNPSFAPNLPHEPSSHRSVDELPCPAPKKRPPPLLRLNEPQRLRGIPWSSRVLRGENHQPRRLQRPGIRPDDS
jgi:hypothetical protein